MKHHKVTITFNKEAYTNLIELEEKAGLDRTTLFRRALALLDIYTDAQARGATIALREPDGTEETLTFDRP